MKDVTRAHIVVRGHVQGVGFRYFTANRAREAGLGGWVRNRPDGTVEAIAVGPRVRIEGLVESLERGPGQVSGVEVGWEEGGLEEPGDFKISV